VIAGQELSLWLPDVQIKNLEIVNSDSAPGTGGVAEDRGGRSSPKIILYLNLSTSPARYARRPLLCQQPVQVMLRWTGADFIK